MRTPANSFLLIAALLGAPIILLAQTPDPARAAADLLAADRAFAAASARTDMIAGISAMFAANVVVPAPGIGFAEGKAAATATLRRDTLNASSRATWTPLQAGVSGDGTHGFTIGFLDVTRADGTHVPGKYLAYWIQGSEGWRVAVYRRVRRSAGAVDSSTLAPILPARGIPGRTDALLIERDRTSLRKAESDFSSLATEIGLGPAFARIGDPRAMHVEGGPSTPDMVRGNLAIARSVAEGLAEGANPYNWAADHGVLIAPSGDFGVTLGYIFAKEPAADGTARPGFPFFTIWRRESATAPWRFIAE